MTLAERLAARVGSESTANNGVQNTPELRRILNLPYRDLDMSIDMSIRFLKPLPHDCPGCPLCASGTPKLWPLQSAALIEAEKTHGLLGLIGVGWGKTLLGLLLPSVILCKKAVLLVPPAMRAQLLQVDLPRIQRHYQIETDKIEIVAYSQLSNAKHADILERIAPDLIVADEAHRLKNKTGAGVKRFLRYMKAHPGCKFVALSGTLTTKSVSDYGVFSHLALGSGSPLPDNYRDLVEWSEALDVNPTRQPGALRALIKSPLDSVRDGYRRRLVSTPGVVATDESALGCSLNIRALPFTWPPNSPALEAIRGVLKTWTTPGGEELTAATEVAACLRQLSMSFFYYWAWPNGIVDREWLEVRAEWHRALRNFLTFRSRPGLDSPMLVTRAASKAGCATCRPDKVCKDCGKWFCIAFEDWRRVKDRPKPPTLARWVDDSVLTTATVWGAKTVERGETGIIWYSHSAVYDRLIQAGIRAETIFGPGDDERLALATADHYPIIWCSVGAHGTGKNLQAWQNGLILSHPSSGAIAEQLYARQHRPGQKADEVNFDVLLHTAANSSALQNALKDARYIEETTGQKQKLNYATKVLDPKLVVD